MQRRRGVLIVLLVSLFLPTITFAQEKSTEVGIGFSEVDTSKQPSPSDIVTPINNILPATSTAQAAKPFSLTSQGTLPKTGEDQSSKLRFIGVLCLMACYWLFLFSRMKGEEEGYD